VLIPPQGRPFRRSDISKSNFDAELGRAKVAPLTSSEIAEPTRSRPLVYESKRAERFGARKTGRPLLADTLPRKYFGRHLRRSDSKKETRPFIFGYYLQIQDHSANNARGTCYGGQANGRLSAFRMHLRSLDPLTGKPDTGVGRTPCREKIIPAAGSMRYRGRFYRSFRSPTLAGREPNPNFFGQQARSPPHRSVRCQGSPLCHRQGPFAIPEILAT